MSAPYTGGCACGAVRYEVDAEPLAMVDCQCRQCQRDSGTGHQSHLAFPKASARTQGTASLWESVGDGGTVKINGFCPTCGTTVFMTFRDRDVFAVRAASLDDPSKYKPQIVTWTDAAVAWDRVDPKLPSFARMPPQAG
ncbi:GFA family protein [Roseiterribacter gracilis]|uniref:Aldehyde-activating protein n=1 Tax=Roseiterribacter gracilis TaxID=2812848 RepID=A0A8S8X5V2_9PROT|nr:aldehyde-activating protein [Rhodospirillales bacterium TMPK1]